MVSIIKIQGKSLLGERSVSSTLRAFLGAARTSNGGSRRSSRSFNPRIPDEPADIHSGARCQLKAFSDLTSPHAAFLLEDILSLASHLVLSSLKPAADRGLVHAHEPANFAQRQIIEVVVLEQKA